MHPFARGNCLITAGIAISIVGVVFLASFKVIFNSVLNNKLIIAPDSAIYDQFTAPTVPVYLNFYFFDVLNPDDVQNEGAKPELEEMGPYIYLEKNLKFDYIWNDDGTVDYRESTTYFFEPDLSNGTEDDLITSLNPIMLIFAAEEYQHSVFLKLIWPNIEAVMDLFETHSVGEWLFYGYELPSFDFRVNRSYHLTGPLYNISCELDHCISLLESNRFGYYYGKNGSDDGIYKVNTGENGMDDYLYIQEWNNDSVLHYWGEDLQGKDPYCNMINGTDGTQFPPRVDKSDSLPVYTTDLCRSISFNYVSEITVQDKVDCYHFVLPKEALQSGDTNPDNRCYCIPLPDDESVDGCTDDAMLNLAPCFHGIPIVMSTPHFYQGNESNVEAFVGLDPQKELHETYLDVEPKTGIVMQAAKRIQLNLPLKQYGSISTFKKVPEVIFPILWADENAIIPEDDAKTAHFLLESLFIIVYTVLSFLLLIGVILIIIGVCKKTKSKSGTLV